MIAPLGTLAFLATLWLIVVLGAAVLEESGAKIAAPTVQAIPVNSVGRRSHLEIRFSSTPYASPNSATESPSHLAGTPIPESARR